MKKEIRNFIGTSMLLILAVNVMGMLIITRPASGFTCNESLHIINPATGDGEFKFWSNVTKLGDTFWANIVIKNFDGLYTWQVRLLFNPEHVNVEAAEYGNIFANLPRGWQTSPTTPVIDNDAGYLLWGNSLVGNVYGVNGTEATLFRVQFKIMKEPPRYGQLESYFTFYFGTGGTFIQDGPTGNYKQTPTELPTTPGHYLYEWVLPLKPWLEVYPAQTIVGNKEEFNVSIYVKQLSEEWRLFAVQLMLFYDATLLEVMDVTEGPFMQDPRWNLYGTYPIVHIEDNCIIMGDMILPNATGYWDQEEFPNGDGELFIITFRPIHYLPASAEFTIEPLNNKFFIDVDNNVIPHDPPVSGTYEFAPVSAPLLAVQPAECIASHIGEIFNVDLTIDNLDAQWEVVNTELKLRYNSSYLEVIDVAEGPFMASFPTPPNTPENCTEFEYEITETYVHISIKLLPNATGHWAVFPHGAGTLATITFNVTSRPPAFCNLQIEDVKITDTEGREIHYDKEDGYYRMIEVLNHVVSVPPHTFTVQTVSDALVSPIVFNQRLRFIYFNVSGISRVPGFVNITIPNGLMWLENPTIDEWFVLVDGVRVTPEVSSNETHTILHFTVEFASIKHVYIFTTGVIPEFPSIFLLAALLTITSAALIILRSRQKTMSRKLLNANAKFRKNF